MSQSRARTQPPANRVEEPLTQRGQHPFLHVSPPFLPPLSTPHSPFLPPLAPPARLPSSLSLPLHFARSLRCSPSLHSHVFLPYLPCINPSLPASLPSECKIPRHTQVAKTKTHLLPGLHSLGQRQVLKASCREHRRGRGEQLRFLRLHVDEERHQEEVRGEQRGGPLRSGA